MILLHQPPAAWGLPSLSPFCVKLETYLRMAKLEYCRARIDPREAPKGKFPYVRVDGKLLGDSGQIVDYLKATRGDPLDASLSAEQRALALAMRRMVEEHLFFAVAHLRWTQPESLAQVRSAFLRMLPRFLGPLIFAKIRRDMLAAQVGQGMGRHSEAEIVAFACEDIAAISVLLGEKRFFFGDAPTSIDAVLYGFLIHVLWVPWENEVTRAARTFPNLEAYCGRMKEKFWP